jgi:chemotaxis signal transduction protein
MQQLQMPELKRPDAARSHPESSNFDCIARAQRGETAAIASLLNHKLNSIGIQVQANRKGAQVAILVESDSTPDSQTLLAWLRQELSALQLDDIHTVAVYGRAIGARLPAWQETIELPVAPRIDAKTDVDHLQLSDWLRQGLDRNIAEFLQFPTRELAGSALPEAEQSQFLRFYFNSNEAALLPLEGIKEVLKVPVTAILPVPQMPPSVIGVYNCRGTILWLVDLGKQVGFGGIAESGWHRFAQSPNPAGAMRSPFNLARQLLTVIVVEIEHQTLGLVVPNVLDIEQHPLQHMQPPAADLFAPGLLPFIQGLLARSGTPVLSLSALMHDSTLQIHRQL